jgi:hypothetical protein
MTTTGYTVYREHIKEHAVPGKPLGRHVHHDSRSLLYPYRESGAALKDTLLTRHVGILDQGSVGSCTGNAETGALGTDPLYGGLSSAQQAKLSEKLALALYSAAEVIDNDGPYPPNDNGSTGLSVCKAAKNAGLISGYVHCLSLASVLDAISAGSPVIIGSNWYDSMDTPDSSGLVTISADAQVRGGHEYLARGIDTERKLVFLDNSWGTSYGVKGSFSYSWDTLQRLLSEQGDGTVSVPLSQPAPTPQPTPTPTPSPADPSTLLHELAALVRSRATHAKLLAFLTANGI